MLIAVFTLSADIDTEIQKSTGYLFPNISIGDVAQAN